MKIKEKIEKIDFFLAKLEFLIENINKEGGIDKILKKKFDTEIIQRANQSCYRIRESALIEDSESALGCMMLEKIEEKIYTCFWEIEKIKTEEKRLEFLISCVEGVFFENEKEIKPLKERLSKIFKEVHGYKEELNLLINSLEKNAYDYNSNLQKEIRHLGLEFPLPINFSQWNEEFENSWFETLRPNISAKELSLETENLDTLLIKKIEKKLPLPISEKENYSLWLESFYQQHNVNEWLYSEINFLRNRYPDNINGVVPLPPNWKKTRHYLYLSLTRKRDDLEVELINFVRLRIQEEYERLEEFSHYQRKVLLEEKKKITTQAQKETDIIKKESKKSWKEKEDCLIEIEEKRQKKISENEEKLKSLEEKVRIYRRSIINRETEMIKKKAFSSLILEDTNTEINKFAFCHYFRICALASGIAAPFFILFLLIFKFFF